MVRHDIHSYFILNKEQRQRLFKTTLMRSILILPFVRYWPHIKRIVYYRGSGSRFHFESSFAYGHYSWVNGVSVTCFCHLGLLSLLGLLGLLGLSGLSGLSGANKRRLQPITACKTHKPEVDLDKVELQFVEWRTDIWPDNTERDLK